jgi:hypothetical protein
MSLGTNRTQFALTGMQNGAFGPYLITNIRVFISLTPCTSFIAGIPLEKNGAFGPYLSTNNRIFILAIHSKLGSHVHAAALELSWQELFARQLETNHPQGKLFA